MTLTADRPGPAAPLPWEITIPHPGRLALKGLPQIIEASVVPPALFFLVFSLAGRAWALLACLLWSYTAILRRAFAGRRLPAILVVGACLITLRTVASLVTRSVSLYFIQPILGSVFLAITFTVSVAYGRPLMMRMIEDFCPLSPEVAASPRVRSIMSRLTLGWALVHLINATITATLLFATPLGVFLLVKAVGIYAVTATAVVASVLWGRRAGRACGITLLFAPREPAGPLLSPVPPIAPGDVLLQTW